MAPLWISLSDRGDVGAGTAGWKMEILAVFMDPERYARPLPIEALVADRKVFFKGVERYRQMLLKGERLRPIIVVKHPTKDLYAVLDGHHRFWAQKEAGVEMVDCAVITDYYGLTFYFTKKGVWQPPAEFTEKVRIPLIRWGQGLVNFLQEFMEHPNRMQWRWAVKEETVEEPDEEELR